ncbi:hypothetical protein, partial [Escherichia coli]|uniref:hypothetical protein n=1 Tax=Escherichia coli TaxID=562 RepID=UPI003D3679D3
GIGSADHAETGGGLGGGAARFCGGGCEQQQGEGGERSVHATTLTRFTAQASRRLRRSSLAVLSKDVGKDLRCAVSFAGANRLGDGREPVALQG